MFIGEREVTVRGCRRMAELLPRGLSRQLTNAHMLLLVGVCAALGDDGDIQHE